MEDFETLFLNKIKPYEAKIQELENMIRDKDIEIVSMKHAVANLSRIVEALQAQNLNTPARPTTANPRAPSGSKYHSYHF